MSTKQEPLAVRLRPQNLEEFVGQSHLLGEGKLLKRVILSGNIPPLIFYGPPGTGKTSLGFIIAKSINAEFQYLNASFSSVGEVKSILKEAKKKLELGRKTLLFIDEIHRFNKLQQEILIPDTESGSIYFIGTTIYNPFYYLIPSLISRSIVAQFKPLSKDEIITLLKRALKEKERGLGEFNVCISEETLQYIAINSSGDARKALSSLEIGVTSTSKDIEGKINFDLTVAKESIQKELFYDRKDTFHYDTISAFIKSIRGSDPDSALYWLAKMLVGGEDPRFIARRLIILASEDIGNADPFALVLANSCFNAVETVGIPEANLILAQTTIYLACSPKSNSCYRAIEEALKDVEKEETIEVPNHIKTYSKDYKYPHNYQVSKDIGGFISQSYGGRRKYYFPKSIGEEKKLKYFLEQLEKIKKESNEC
ncbi:MAG: replication-associated recombination protein A [Candidatus Omnitrophica bacterium]|nr:replication-associated recombination protein A [Candidatus Omnitrophota bacterium]MCM8826510.1 replication-associated recombination protein A [Candidatus Omnitrophota bacterium]